ncbi:MAG: hypothetical protein V1784_01265 [bacterium]
MDFKAENFYDELSRKCKEVNNTISGMVSGSYYTGTHAEEEHDRYEMLLKYQVQDLYRSTFVALDALGLHASRDALKDEYCQFSHRPTSLEYIPSVGTMTNPATDCISSYVEAIGAGLSGESVRQSQQETERGKLERILVSTPTIIYDQKLEPKNEAEVRRVMFNLLKISYPDTIREFSIGQELKSFKPDFGIRSLKTAIEYKYAATEQEAKICVDGIFADMHGYSGSQDWQWFYAVIYQTEAFVTQAQVNAQFAAVEKQGNWKCFVVTGKGTRAVRKASSKKGKPTKPKKGPEK